MSMVKRATGKIEKFTNADGEEVMADNLVWADEKQKLNFLAFFNLKN